MEIRMAYPNEIKRIMEIIQDAKESLAQRQVDQWQDGYPDEEIIFEDILESRGYVAVEDQEVVAYAAVRNGNLALFPLRLNLEGRSEPPLCQQLLWLQRHGEK